MQIIKESALFYCVHLLDVDNTTEVIHSFTSSESTGYGLEKYLKNVSLREEAEHETRTYLVFDKETHELVGFFSLKAGNVSVNESGIFHKKFDTFSGVELSNFGVNQNYKLAHKEAANIGKDIVENFVFEIIEEASTLIGIKVFYIFSLPYKKLLSYYEKLGFHRLSRLDEKKLHRRIKPSYDQSCIFMYQIIQ